MRLRLGYICLSIVMLVFAYGLRVGSVPRVQQLLHSLLEEGNDFVGNCESLAGTLKFKNLTI